ncbi:hypothetical protein ACFLQ5_01955 [Bacteroidota bacterium]
MTFNDVLTKLKTLLPNSELSINVELRLEEDEDILLRLEFTTNEAASVLLSFQVCFNKKDLAEAVQALQSKGTLPVEDKDIEVFVKRKNLDLLQYLKEYNKDFTDYHKLAEMYHYTRGSIIGKRFGF